MFKPGDKLKCIDNTTREQVLTIGNVYICLDVCDQLRVVDVITDVGIRALYDINRFVLYMTKENSIDYLSITKEIVGG